MLLARQTLIWLLIGACCTSLFGQEQSKADYYAQQVVTNEFVHPKKARAYIDTLNMLGGLPAREGHWLRAQLCSNIGDSMQVAYELIIDCLAENIQAQDTSMIIECLITKSFIERNLQQFYSSLNSLGYASKLATASNQLVFVPNIELDLGNAYLDLTGDTAASLEHLHNCIRVAVQVKDWRFAYEAQHSLAEILLARGQKDRAIAETRKGMSFSEEMDVNDPTRYFANYKFGCFLIEIDKCEEAIEQGNICYAKGNELEMNYLLFGGSMLLAEAYMECEDLEKAMHYSKINIELGEASGDIYGLLDAYEIGWRILEKKGMHEEALQMLKQLNTYESQIKDESKVVGMTRALYKGELARRDIEKEKIAVDLSLAQERSRLKTYLISSAAILLLLITIYTAVLYRKRKQEATLNRILAASNEVVNKQKEELLKTLQEKEKEEGYFYFNQSAIKVEFKDIILLESSNNYVLIHIAGRKIPLLERTKMIHLVQHFPETMFVRIHRSYYVNVNHIISRPSKYVVRMSNEKMLTASRNYVSNLGDKFMQEGATA